MKSLSTLQTSSSNLYRSCTSVNVTYCTSRDLLTLQATAALKLRPFYRAWKLPNLTKFTSLQFTDNVKGLAIIPRKVYFRVNKSLSLPSFVYIKTTFYSTNKIASTLFNTNGLHTLLTHLFKSSFNALSCQFYKTFLFNLHLARGYTKLYTHSYRPLHLSRGPVSNLIKHL